MPKLPHWYRRVPDILRELKTHGMPPILDRPAIEGLFAVRRRQAIRLLNAANGYQVGKTFIIDRRSLIDYLEGIEKSGAAPEARARKQRVAFALAEAAQYAQAQRVQVRTSPDALQRRPADLPAAIDLIAPGKLQISFQSAEDLLAQVVELAAAAANDFHAFQKLYRGRE
jgi:hypothetical protein